MKALHVLVRRSGGGTETNVNRLVHAVPDFEVMALEDAMGFPLKWRQLPNAIRELRSREPDVVFCYGITSHLVAAMAWPRRMPLIGSIRCESDFAGVKGLLKKLIAPRFSEWISNSRMALQGRPGTVIYNGIEPPPDEVPMLKDLPHPVLGLLARGHAKKGHRFLMGLWEELGKPGSLVFAGALPEDLQRDAEALGVVCTGHVKPGPLLRSLDLMVMPSEAEGIPTAMLEAMVRGVPCLATPVGGIPEMVTHGVTGFVLPREQWAAFLKDFDWSRLPGVGEAGRQHVLSNFGFERMKAEFVAAAERNCKRAKRSK